MQTKIECALAEVRDGIRQPLVLHPALAKFMGLGNYVEDR